MNGEREVVRLGPARGAAGVVVACVERLCWRREEVGAFGYASLTWEPLAVVVTRGGRGEAFEMTGTATTVEALARRWPHLREPLAKGMATG